MYNSVSLDIHILTHNALHNVQRTFASFGTLCIAHAYAMSIYVCKGRFYARRFQPLTQCQKIYYLSSLVAMHHTHIPTQFAKIPCSNSFFALFTHTENWYSGGDVQKFYRVYRIAATTATFSFGIRQKFCKFHHHHWIPRERYRMLIHNTHERAHTRTYL